jgi:hypothetical protein
VEWPATSSASLDVCVIGNDQMAQYMETRLAGNMVGTRKATVRNRPGAGEMLFCKVIYLGRSEKGVASQVAQAVMGKQILTVSEFPELGSVGIVISFYLDEERVRFEVHMGSQPVGIEIEREAVATRAPCRRPKVTPDAGLLTYN